MKTYFLGASCLFLLASFNLKNSVDAADPSCKSALSMVLKFQMQQLGTCTKELGYKGKEKSEKMNCIMKCVAMSTGALLPDGNFDVESAMKFVLKSIPVDSLYKAVIEGLDCQKVIVGKLNDPSDTYCRAYEPLIKCITAFAMNLCNK